MSDLGQTGLDVVWAVGLAVSIVGGGLLLLMGIAAVAVTWVSAHRGKDGRDE